jgi:hypothetical protein
MPSLFGIDIAAIVYEATKGQLIKGTITKVTEGARNPLDITAGLSRTETDYPLEGFIESKRFENAEGFTTLKQGEIITIIGNSCAVVPEVSDKITMEGTKFTILNIMRDPAAATYECLVER